MPEVVYRVDVTIQGITPLLHHKAGLIEKKSSRADTDYSDEWKATVYTSQFGPQKTQVVMPALNLEACIRNAGKGRKIGKLFLPRLIATGVSVDGFEFPMRTADDKPICVADIEANDWIFACRAVVQRQGVNRVRAMLPVGWQVSFPLEVSRAILKPDLLQSVLEEAGTDQGLCDWRPGAPKPGKFGQFEVVQFDVHPAA